MSAATGGRIVCPKCGANNFDTQAACWKCSSPLTGAGAGYTAGAVSPPPSVPPSGASLNAAPPVSPYAAPAPRLSTGVDPSVAIWSAIALAVFFGAIAIPVGLVFMMLDDRRKVEIGKVTLISGIVSTIVHAVLTAWLIQALFFTVLMPRAIQAFGGAAGGGDLNQKVAPLNFPGIPRTPEPEVNFPAAPTYNRPMPR